MKSRHIVSHTSTLVMYATLGIEARTPVIWPTRVTEQKSPISTRPVTALGSNQNWKKNAWKWAKKTLVYINTSNGCRVVTVVSISATNWEALVKAGYESWLQCRWCA